MNLAVYLHGARVGTLARTGGTDYAFAYTPQTVSVAGAGAIVLSQSLPVQEEPYDPIATRTFFEGLLPEGVRRDELARELRVGANDSYALMAEIGRDCAGAVVMIPEGTPLPSERSSVTWLTEEDLARLVEELPRRPLGVSRTGRKMRLSLAGVQRKLTLIRSGSGRFGQPEADAPSTHLIKPQYSDEYPNLVHNEMFCMRVAECAGLPVAATELREIAGHPCIVSQRFDRSSSGAGTTRLHQEDLCQALGIPPNLKYQADSGPGFRHLRELLQEIGRGVDMRTVVRAAVCNFVLGNSDAHGKNFAILFAELGRRLAPLYDLVSTAAYDLEVEMAMSVGEVYDPDAVTLADWIDMSADCDLAPGPFLKLVRDTADQVGACAASVAELARAEGWHVPLIDEIVAVTERRGERITAEVGDV